MKKIYVLSILLVFSCTKNKITNILPNTFNSSQKISEKVEKKDLELVSQFNINGKLMQMVEAEYKDKSIIKKFSYPDSILAYSEYSMSRDIVEKEEGYQFSYKHGNSLIVLSQKDIYVINSSKKIDMNKIPVKAKSDVKFPKNKFDYVQGSQKLILGEGNTFPFYKKYILGENTLKNIVFNTIVPYNNESSKNLEDFIKKQNIIKNEKNIITFELKEKEEDEENRFLWLKSSKILILSIEKKYEESIYNN